MKSVFDNSSVSKVVTIIDSKKKSFSGYSSIAWYAFSSSCFYLPLKNLKPLGRFIASSTISLSKISKTSHAIAMPLSLPARRENQYGLECLRWNKAERLSKILRNLAIILHHFFLYQIHHSPFVYKFLLCFVC